MNRSKLAIPALVAVTALITLALFAFAADHSEAPGTQADNAADIADFYAWHEGNKLVAIITYGGLQATSDTQTATYDENVLYTVHIDSNGDQVADKNVRVRFGKNGAGAWGVRVDNLPGATDAVIGAANSVIDAGNGLSVYTGLRDDPFFFDLEGFNKTLATGTLAFDGTRDSVAGLNVSSIVLEMDLAAASSGSDKLALWASTGRK